MTDDLKDIWAKVDARNGPQRMETEAEHIARDMREGNFPKRSDPIQVPVSPPSGMTDANIREIWMPPLWEVGDGTIPTSAQCEDDDIRYILATPSVLAADLAVKALIADAEARAAREAYRKACVAVQIVISRNTPDDGGDADPCLIDQLEAVEGLIKREAAALRGETP